MARLRTLSAFLVLALLLLPHSLRATTCEDGSPAAHISFRSIDVPYCSYLPFQSFTIVNVYIRSLPLTKVRFSVPDPPLGVVVIGETWNFPATGNRVTGVELNLGGCTSMDQWGYLYLGQMVAFAPSGVGPGCATWAANTGAEIDDCNGAVRAASSQTIRVSADPPANCPCIEGYCQGLPATDLSPPDGATGIPTNAPLTWEGTSEVYDTYCWVQIGTDPDCATWSSYPADCATQSFAPDFLQPGATYYWRLSVNNAFCSAVYSPSQSFTTTGPLATQAATWGRVKAMYRE